MIDPLERFVGQLEIDLDLLKPDRLRQRLEALDRLDAYFPELARQAIQGPELPGPELRGPELRGPEMRGPEMQGAEINSSPAAGLARRAKSIRDRLESQNRELYEAIQDQVRRGAGRLQLLRWLELGQGEHAELARGMEFDFRDDLISGLLELEQPEDERPGREAEMVFYQPTPARHIFNLIGLAALEAEDVFVDIGSGLGHVPLLIAISTDARAIGIELEGAYVERARQCAERLNLARVAFFEQDARAADYSFGTVFYFYTPFSGAMLEAVLERLKHEAASRRIRICTYGPSTSRIADQRWLRATSTPETDRITIFDSRD